MATFFMAITVNQEKLKEIFKEMHEAEEKIYDCYNRLQEFTAFEMSGVEENTPDIK